MQQRDGLAGAGQLVLDQAVMGQLGELLNADACLVQGFVAGPGPERVLLGGCQVRARAGDRVFGVHVDRLPAAGGDRPAQRGAAGGEQLTGSGGGCGSQPLGRGGALGADVSQQRGHRRDAFAGPLVHPRLAVRASLPD